MKRGDVVDPSTKPLQIKRKAGGRKLDQARIEAELNLMLLNIVEIKEAIRDGVEGLREEGKLTMEFEKMVQNVIRDVDGWTDQCTATAEAPPVLLRRMQVQVERLNRIERIIEEMRRQKSG
ncbi:MAG: Uncharacterized protein XD72_1882 [Methanothrix harundinacea]|uniref:Uncharacterized protein n=1 Tax=Methanothrix harundinacea TaxID=301375 RepID=A0A101IHA4_9EURY|nr:MAG: Uncharacterized protein XD72_1882 [Methanothrix harundinacea]KUK95255.1 MAG: Uncharacterized protein XE07_1867 [Methanothrix harundinacea]